MVEQLRVKDVSDQREEYRTQEILQAHFLDEINEFNDHINNKVTPEIRKLYEVEISKLN